MPLLTYDEALQIVLAHAAPLDSIRLPTVQSGGLRLSADVSALVSLPLFDNSQMDGYAVRSSDLQHVSNALPKALRCTGTVAAGSVKAETVTAGETFKIFTGAPIPRGADAVVPIEDVEIDDDNSFVLFHAEVEPDTFIRKRGEDLNAGEIIAHKGDRITPGRLALLLSAGCGEVDVYRRARVVILTNGDELVSASVSPSVLTSGQVYESNGSMLSALVQETGGELVRMISASDSRLELLEKLGEIIEIEKPDLIISTGGVSVGDRDFIRSVVAELGTVIFWRAAIRPGKPVLYARIGEAHFLGLPGNPASTLVTFELFARPLIDFLQGEYPRNRYVPVRVLSSITHEPGRRSFVRAFTTITASGLVAAPTGSQGSHYVTSLSAANSLLVLAENQSELTAGSIAECLLIGPVGGE